jgi:hypothetical protein
MSTSEQNTVRQISDYERLSGIFWIVLGILQCLTIFVFYIFGPVVGIWNIMAGISHLKRSPRILARDPAIPSEYESLGGIIAIGIVNLVIGGVIGIVFAILDFVIRDKVLSNRHAFNGHAASV